ncbi:MAG: hypothetical protein R3B09_32805 [Nannocystaceae bacterium]
MRPMEGEHPGVDDLLAEIAGLSDEALADLARGPRSVHPLRARLDTAERLADARRALADLDRRHAAEIWRSFGAGARAIAPIEIAARQRQALVTAWARLGGDALHVHLQRSPRPPAQRLSPKIRAEAPRIALDRNPGVPRAPVLVHPASLDEAARFAVLRPLLDRCVALAERAALALDAIGQPTHALARWASRLPAPPRRIAVWRLRHPHRGDRVRDRRVILTAGQVALDAAAPPGLRAHPSSLALPEITVAGALAWRRAVEGDAIVREHEPRRWSSHVLHLNPRAIGRRYRDLVDPFAPLLAILRLGCRLHGFSSESMTLEVGPSGH